jgi:hypothetical protein
MVCPPDFYESCDSNLIAIGIWGFNCGFNQELGWLMAERVYLISQVVMMVLK